LEVSNALLGIQPTFRQVPPSSLSFSMIAVLSPSWPARMAATYPPGPEPMITTSNFSINQIRAQSKNPVAEAFRCMAGSLGFARDDGILEIDRQGFRVFNSFLHFDEECDRLFPIDDAVVVAECQVHHRTDYDRAIYGNRALHDFVHAQNAALRRIQNWGAQERAIDAAIRNRKGPAL